MHSLASEILLNARQVTQHKNGDAYEFILNDTLHVVECVKVTSAIRGIMTPIKNISEVLNGLLFELNHVRVNPKVDNTFIIKRLTKALEDIGVSVTHTPSPDAMATCFKPLGEITDNVRFYLSANKTLVFLSPASRLKLIRCN